MTKSRVMVVTGGARGIGYAVVRDLAERGYSVVLADRDGAESSAASLQTQGLSVRGFAVDVADEGRVADLMDFAEECFGAVHGLVNNAGIYSSLTPKAFEELTVQDWQQVLNVNVIGLFNCCKHVMPVFRRAGQGSIVNISSMAADRADRSALDQSCNSKGSSMLAATLRQSNRPGCWKTMP